MRPFLDGHGDTPEPSSAVELRSFAVDLLASAVVPGEYRIGVLSGLRGATLSEDTTTGLQPSLWRPWRESIESCRNQVDLEDASVGALRGINTFSVMKSWASGIALRSVFGQLTATELQALTHLPGEGLRREADRAQSSRGRAEDCFVNLHPSAAPKLLAGLRPTVPPDIASCMRVLVDGAAEPVKLDPVSVEGEFFGWATVAVDQFEALRVARETRQSRDSAWSSFESSLLTDVLPHERLTRAVDALATAVPYVSFDGHARRATAAAAAEILDLVRDEPALGRGARNVLASNLAALRAPSVGGGDPWGPAEVMLGDLPKQLGRMAASQVRRLDADMRQLSGIQGLSGLQSTLDRALSAHRAVGRGGSPPAL